MVPGWSCEPFMGDLRPGERSGLFPLLVVSPATQIRQLGIKAAIASRTALDFLLFACLARPQLKHPGVIKVVEQLEDLSSQVGLHLIKGSELVLLLCFVRGVHNRAHHEALLYQQWSSGMHLDTQRLVDISTCSIVWSQKKGELCVVLAACHACMLECGPRGFQFMATFLLAGSFR
eukprot:1141134-Pelagomonas_calceolata.AAC.2